MVGIAIAVVLLAHFLFAALGGASYVRHRRLANCISWCLCGASRMALVLFDWAGYGAAGGEASPDLQQLVFHSLLVMQFSLFAHQES
ncbi:guanylate cyclase domain-containing protein, partial [Haematococcus lacustris]